MSHNKRLIKFNLFNLRPVQANDNLGSTLKASSTNEHAGCVKAIDSSKSVLTFKAGGPNNSNYNAPVRVTFAKIPSTSGDTSSTHLDENGEIQPNVIERICFNIGRELFVYDFK